MDITVCRSLDNLPCATSKLVLFILGRSVLGGPLVQKSQSVPIPDSFHQQQPDRNQGDDDDWEGGCSFCERDDEDDDGDEDLSEGVAMDAPIALD